MSVYIVLAVTAVSLIYLLWRKIFTYWERIGIHQFPVDPLYGNMKGVGSTRHFSALFQEYYRKTKNLGLKFSGLYFTLRPTLIITDLDLIKNILVKDFNNFPNRGQYLNEKDDPLSAHLFNIENDPWRNLRHKMTPTFTSGKLKMMFGTISDVADKLLNVIEKQLESTGQLEVKDTLARFTTDVIGSTAFGLECNSLDDKNSKFYEMGTSIFARPVSLVRRFLMSTFRDLARFFRMKSIPDEVSSFYLGITRETVKYREENPSVNRQDFIKLLVDMKKQNSITVEQIAAQSFIFFLAGFETSSSTMNFCMYELSINEDVQEKAREDVRQALMKHNGELTYDAIGDMDYLERCIDETLRKYSVVTALQRVALNAYKLPGTDIVLPKGQAVSIPVQAIQHDEEIYPNPQKFDPDRFTPEEVAKRHPFAYMPFGEGPRVCIGMRFAMVEMKIGFAKILMKYKFTLDRTKTSVPLKIVPNLPIVTPTEKIIVNLVKIE